MIHIPGDDLVRSYRSGHILRKRAKKTAAIADANRSHHGLSEPYEEPTTPTDSRRLALGIGLRYTTPDAQGKTKNNAALTGLLTSPFLSNRLAPFCSASLAPYSAPFTTP